MISHANNLMPKLSVNTPPCDVISMYTPSLKVQTPKWAMKTIQQSLILIET